MGATVRRMELRLPDQPDLTLGADLGVALAKFPGLEVRTPLNVCRRPRPGGVDAVWLLGRCVRAGTGAAGLRV